MYVELYFLKLFYGQVHVMCGKFEKVLKEMVETHAVSFLHVLTTLKQKN